MKTFVILSDTHRNTQPFEKIATVLSECDCIVHLGDVASDAKTLMRLYPEKTYAVSGNNDFYGEYPSEIVIEAEGHRIFACHGHRYSVKYGTQRLVDAAKQNGCDIALYGHTHIAEYHEEEGVFVINPGCMQRFSPSISYCYLVLAGKKAVPTIVEIGH